MTSQVERTVTRPWPSILTRYREVCSFNPAALPMLCLTEHIVDAPRNYDLQAWTSHNALCIVQKVACTSYRGPRLVIDPGVVNGCVELRFQDTWIEKDQWVRLVPPTQVINRFKLFLYQLHWVQVPLFRSHGPLIVHDNDH